MRAVNKLAFFLVSSLIINTNVNASIDNAWSLLRKSKGSTKYYPAIVQELVKNKLYFASVPYIKEYMATTKEVKNSRIDHLIDEVVKKVGVRQFEVLPTTFLKRSKAPMVKYILAKKYFRKAKYSKVLEVLNKSIPRRHSVKPFSLFLEASVYSIKKKHNSAIKTYEECVERSDEQLSKYKKQTHLRQLKINRDYCLAGIARVQFAAKKHEKANLSYLDIPKTSYIWPEILFEEAWNSFYERDYNRTLGKLVTYNAPLLKYIFNPEVEVLTALTYMELCLWSDAKKTVDQFYDEYNLEAKIVSRMLRKQGKDYKYYYLLSKARGEGKVRGSELLNRILGAIIRDPAYQELFASFKSGREELRIVRTVTPKRFRRILSANLKESLLLQRNLIGAYVRKNIHLYNYQVNSAFENMSYIKLEVLNRRKKQLYRPSLKGSRGRGDIKYLKRNEKQYFWNFNGEFWADELGDYVFSLKSECK